MIDENRLIELEYDPQFASTCECYDVDLKELIRLARLGLAVEGYADYICAGCGCGIHEAARSAAKALPKEVK